MITLKIPFQRAYYSKNLGSLSFFYEKKIFLRKIEISVYINIVSADKKRIENKSLEYLKNNFSELNLSINQIVYRVFYKEEEKISIDGKLERSDLIHFGKEFLFAKNKIDWSQNINSWIFEKYFDMEPEYPTPLKDFLKKINKNIFIFPKDSYFWTYRSNLIEIVRSNPFVDKKSEIIKKIEKEAFQKANNGSYIFMFDPNKTNYVLIYTDEYEGSHLKRIFLSREILNLTEEF